MECLKGNEEENELVTTNTTLAIRALCRVLSSIADHEQDRMQVCESCTSDVTDDLAHF